MSHRWLIGAISLLSGCAMTVGENALTGTNENSEWLLLGEQEQIHQVFPFLVCWARFPCLLFIFCYFPYVANHTGRIGRRCSGPLNGSASGTRSESHCRNM